MKRASIAITEDGLATIVAAVAGRKIIAVTYLLTTSGANTVIWQSDATAISGTITIATTVQDGTASAPGPIGILGILETASGEALILNVSADTTIGGYISYILA